MTDRAQVFTLEAFVASLLLLGSVVFAIQVTGITANTQSTSSEQVERELEQTTAGVLDAARLDESIRPTVLYWNTTAEGFHGASESHYVASHPPTDLGTVLEQAFDRPRLAYNLNVRYATPLNETQTQRIVRYGAPSDQAVRAVETVTLYDDDRVYDDTEQPGPQTLAQTDKFYAPDAAPDSPVYNVVRVEVIVWYV